MRLIRIALVLAFCPHFLALAADLPKPVTVEQIYRQDQATRPPDGIAWSPDGTRFSYIDENGDLHFAASGDGEDLCVVGLCDPQ